MTKSIAHSSQTLVPAAEHYHMAPTGHSLSPGDENGFNSSGQDHHSSGSSYGECKHAPTLLVVEAQGFPAQRLYTQIVVLLAFQSDALASQLLSLTAFYFLSLPTQFHIGHRCLLAGPVA